MKLGTVGAMESDKKAYVTILDATLRREYVQQFKRKNEKQIEDLLKRHGQS